ncbi:pentapeptide repeat-containing protein [Micromonospora sp. NPDC047557]|uniref:pentapeptide repeat-containing protein n=1 Tax=Micromonospora sp. NPDC047557 TaxID=3364250 RepID=UPI003713FA12
MFGQIIATGAIFLDDAEFSHCRFTGEANFDGAVFRSSVRFDAALFDGPARFTRTRFDKRAGFDQSTFTEDARFTGARFRSAASFDRVEFRQASWFERVRVNGNLSMAGTTFRRLAWFNSTVIDGSSRIEGSSIEHDSSFEGCKFNGRASFAGTTFGGVLLFTDALFREDASFERCSFAREAKFSRASFGADVHFDQATFSGSIWLEGLTCTGRAMFDSTSFKEQCYTEDAVFAGGIWLTGAEFFASTHFGPMDAGPSLVLNRATFERRTRVHVSADRLVSVGARFLDGVVVYAARADMAFDGSIFAGPSTLAATAAANESRQRARVVSLRRVDVANLTILDLDASACLFAGAYNLDKLKIESPNAFSLSPGSPSIAIGSKTLPVFLFWTRRRVIAEECRWRATRARTPKFLRRRWAASGTQPPPWLGELTDQDPEMLSTDRISSAYRSLRKSYEDAKNEPGAADFYYGEMEMRRKDSTASRADRFILTCYWLISGYGMRAWRAVLALLFVVGTHGVLFALHGFAGRSPKAKPDYLRGQLFALDSLLFNPDRNVQLTTTGITLRLTIKTLGPILLGLAVLAVRNRVKR